jgi:hypothetical protein
MKKTLFVSAIALVSIVLWENNYAGSSSKMATISSEKFPNDTIPKKHKHKKDTTSTPTDTAGVTYVKENRILSAK